MLRTSLGNGMPKSSSKPDVGVGGGNPGVDFRGQRRRLETLVSTTDPQAQLARKGKESRLAYGGHALMDNRHGLVAGPGVTEANDNAEIKAAQALLEWSMSLQPTPATSKSAFNHARELR